MITLLRLEQASQKLIDAALNIQRIAQSLAPTPTVDLTTTSDPSPNPEPPTIPIDVRLGNYPSERTIWDVEAALTLHNMQQGTSFTVADWMVANSVELSGEADKQGPEDTETRGGTKRRAEGVSDAIVVKKPKTPKAKSGTKRKTEEVPDAPVVKKRKGQKLYIKGPKKPVEQPEEQPEEHPEEQQDEEPGLKSKSKSKPKPKSRGRPKKK